MKAEQIFRGEHRRDERDVENVHEKRPNHQRREEESVTEAVSCAAKKMHHAKVAWRV